MEERGLSKGVWSMVEKEEKVNNRELNRLTIHPNDVSNIAEKNYVRMKRQRGWNVLKTGKLDFFCFARAGKGLSSYSFHFTEVKSKVKDELSISQKCLMKAIEESTGVSCLVYIDEIGAEMPFKLYEVWMERKKEEWQ